MKNVSSKKSPGPQAPQPRLGIAHLTRLAFSGANLTEIASELLIDCSRNPANAGALMDLSIIEQLKGNMKAGLDYQLSAFHTCQMFRTGSPKHTRLRLLVLAAPIHMGGNTPIEFLVEQSDIEVITLYVIPGMQLPDPLPDHDLTFIAAPGDSGITLQFLNEIHRITPNWPTPVLNRPENITRLERDIISELLNGHYRIAYCQNHTNEPEGNE